MALVSVFILSYNHSQYIADTFTGILRQKTTFPVEIFVYDDDSTDGTQGVIREFIDKYPGRIKAFLSPHNEYSVNDRFLSYIQEKCLEHTQGEYIAMCEGDDYWCDENKLQMQFEYMEKHPECSMCAHAAYRKDYSIGQQYPFQPYIGDTIIPVDALIRQKNGSLPTASLFYRRDAFGLEDSFPQTDVGDIVNQLYAATKGDVYYIDHEMCVYRYKHPDSWTSTTTDNAYKLFVHSIGMIDFYSRYNEYTQKHYDDAVKWKIREYVEIAVNEYEKIKDNTGLEDNIDKASIYKQIKRICDAREGELTVLSDLFVDNKSHVLIYGNGNFANLTKRYLDIHDISYDGFIVSDDQPISTEDDAKIWHLSDVPFPLAKAIIIVSLSQQWEKEVISNLSKVDTKKILKPFWFDFEDI